MVLIEDFHQKTNTFRRYLVYGLAFTLPISEKISTLFILLSTFATLIVFRKKDVAIFLKGAMPLIALYLIYIIGYSRDDGGFGTYWFETKASLVAFPLILYLSNDGERKNILKYFLYGCILSYVICLAIALYQSFDNFTFDFIDKSRVTDDGIGFIKAIDYNANRLLGSGFISNGLQRSYLAMYFSFALSLVWLCLEHRSIRWRLLLSTILCLGILQTWSLAGVLSLVTVVGYLILVNADSNRIKIVLSGLLIFSILAIISFNNRANFMYRTIVAGNLNLDGPTATTVRLRPWMASIDRIAEDPVWGYGMENAQKSLNAFYESQLKERPRYQWPLDENFNAHNQYFQTILESGLIGLAVFVWAMITFALNLQYYQWDFRLIGWGFLILIVLNFLFESMMSRYMGISFFALFYSLFIHYKKENYTQESLF
jgi:O-antigen ligase